MEVESGVVGAMTEAEVVDNVTAKSRRIFTQSRARPKHESMCGAVVCINTTCLRYVVAAKAEGSPHPCRPCPTEDSERKADSR